MKYYIYLNHEMSSEIPYFFIKVCASNNLIYRMPT